MLRRELTLLQGQIDRADQQVAYLTERLQGVERPVVRTAPHLGWGYPTVGTVLTETVAAAVWAGVPVETVCGRHSLSRGEVLVACWHEARNHPEYTSRWGEWLAAVEPVLARPEPDWHLIPDPPTRKDNS